MMLVAVAVCLHGIGWKVREKKECPGLHHVRREESRNKASWTSSPPFPRPFQEKHLSWSLLFARSEMSLTHIPANPRWEKSKRKTRENAENEKKTGSPNIGTQVCSSSFIYTFILGASGLSNSILPSRSPLVCLIPFLSLWVALTSLRHKLEPQGKSEIMVRDVSKKSSFPLHRMREMDCKLLQGFGAKKETPHWPEGLFLSWKLEERENAPFLSDLFTQDSFEIQRARKGTFQHPPLPPASPPSFASPLSLKPLHSAAVDASLFLVI